MNWNLNVPQHAKSETGETCIHSSLNISLGRARMKSINLSLPSFYLVKVEMFNRGKRKIYFTIDPAGAVLSLLTNVSLP